jgi:hypothetical protein
MRLLPLLSMTALLLGVGAMMTAQGQPAAKPEKVLRHVVLFKFKDSSTKADVKAIEDAFRGLPAKIDAIHDFEWGTDVSVENKSQGFTHCFFVTFRDEKGRDEYLPHPAHQDFVKIVGPHVDRVLVVDYWTQR